MNLPRYTLFSNPLVFQVPIPKVCLCTQKAELRYCEGFWGSTLIMVSLSKSGATCTARACYVRAGTAGSVAVGASTTENNENASLCWDPQLHRFHESSPWTTQASIPPATAPAEGLQIASVTSHSDSVIGKESRNRSRESGNTDK